MAEIDSLEISIQGKMDAAGRSIDRLIDKIDGIPRALKNISSIPVKLDFDSGSIDPSKLKYSLQKSLDKIKVDTSIIGEHLSQSFHITSKKTSEDIEKQLTSMLEEAVDSFNGDKMQISTKSLDSLVDTIVQSGKIARADLSTSFDGVRDEYIEFYNYFKDHKIYISDFLKADIGKTEFNELLGEHLSNVTRDKDKGIELNASWDELSSKFPSVISKDTVNAAEQVVEVLQRIREVRENIKPIAIENFLGEDYKTAIGDVKKTISSFIDISKDRLYEEAVKTYKKSDSSAIVNVNINEDAIVTQIQSGIRKAAKIKYEPLKIDLDIDTKKIKSDLTSKLKGIDLSELSDIFSQFQNITIDTKPIVELSNAITALGRKSATAGIENIPALTKSIKDMLSAFGGVPAIDSSIVQMTQSLADLSKNGKTISSAMKEVESIGNNFSVAEIENSDKLIERMKSHIQQSIEGKEWIENPVDLAKLTNEQFHIFRKMEKEAFASAKSIEKTFTESNDNITKRKTKSFDEFPAGFDKKILVDTFGDSVKDIENYQQAVQKFGNNAGQYFNEIGSNANDTESKIKSMLEEFKDVGKKDFYFEGNTEQLNSEINKLNSDLEKLYQKRDKKIDFGEINTKAFKEIIYEIQSVTNKLDILDAAQPEALNRTLQENAEKAKVLKEQLSKLQVPPIHEEDLYKLTVLLKKANQELQNLKINLSNDLSRGKITENIDDKGYAKYLEKIAIAEKQVEALKNKMNEVGLASPRIEEGEKLFDRTKKTVSRSTKEVNIFKSSLLKIPLSGLKKLFGLIKNISNSIWKIPFEPFKRLSKSILGIGKSSKSNKIGFRKILQYAFEMRTLYTLVEKIRGAIVEGYKNLVLYSDEANAAITRLRSSMLVFKNSVAAAASPIVNALTPSINSMIQIFINATNVVNQFFSSLVGKGTWIKAKDVIDDYAESISGAGKAAKGSLQPFDELNNLTTPSSGGRWSDSINASDMFETVEIDEDIKNFADRLKEYFDSEDWEGLGEEVAGHLNKGLEFIYDALNWENAEKKIQPFIDGITRTINSLNTNIDWELLGETFGTGLNTIVNSINGLFDEIDWTALGESLATSIIGLVNEVNWNEFGRLLMQGLVAKIEALNGFVKEMSEVGEDGLTGWEKLGKSIGDAINSALDEVPWGLLGETFSGLFNGIFSVIGNIAATIDTYEVGSKIASAIKTGLEGINWEDVKSNVNIVAEKLATFLNGLLDPDTMYTVGETIAETLNTAIGAVFTFFNGLDTDNLGESLAGEINGFVDTFDLPALVRTFDKIVNVIFNALKVAVAKIHWGEALEKILDSLKEISLPTVAIVIGAFGFKYLSKMLTGSLISGALKAAIPALTSPVGLIIAGVAATIGLGKFMWDNREEMKQSFNDLLNDIFNDTEVGGLSAADSLFGGKKHHSSAGRTFGEKTGAEIVEGTKEGITKNINGMKGRFDSALVSELEGVGQEISSSSGHNMASNLKEAFEADIEAYSIGSSSEWSTFASNANQSASSEGKVLGDSMHNSFSDTISDGMNSLSMDSFEPWQNFSNKAVTASNLVGENMGKGAESSFQSTYSEKLGNLDVSNLSGWGMLKNAVITLFKELGVIQGNNVITGFQSKTDEIKTNLRTQLESVASNLKGNHSLLSNFKSAGKEMGNYVNSGLKESLNSGSISVDVSGSGGSRNVKTSYQHFYAAGGFPDVGEIFVAREAGPEMVGRMGSRNAIANNGQIAQGFADAVYPAIYNAVSSAMRNNKGSGNVTFQVEGDPAGLFRVFKKEWSHEANRTQKNPVPIYIG